MDKFPDVVSAAIIEATGSIVAGLVTKMMGLGHNEALAQMDRVVGETMDSLIRKAKEKQLMVASK